MTLKAIIESSEHGRIEIDYSSMSSRELNRRIRNYQQKYGMSFSGFNRHFSCGSASPRELQDMLDWEDLVCEKLSRKKSLQRSTNFFLA